MYCFGMNIFKTIAASVYNPEFYKEARGHSVGRVVGYWAKLSLLLGLVAFLYALVVISPIVSKGVAEAKSRVYTVYPPELVVKITKGVVTTNAASEPVTIPLPISAEERKDMEGESIPTNLAVIDTQAEGTLSFDAFKQMDTVFFIGKNYVINHDDKSAIQYHNLSESPDFTFDKALIDNVLYYGSFASIVIPIGLFFGIFVSTFSTLVYLFLLALVLMLLARLMGRHFTYGESYKTAAYASTAPTILLLVILPFAPHVTFLFSLLTLIVAIVNFPPKTTVEARTQA